MKEKIQKLYNVCLRMIPVCSSLMLVCAVNSTMSWVRGQEELPESVKKYRKF